MKITAIKADITTLTVDVIVNAANSSLLGGGGVDGAIHKAAGPELLDVCIALDGCPTGYAKVTPGFRLPAKHIIHAVGPVWKGGSDSEAVLLGNCYYASLQLAQLKECRSIAFPCISTGIFGFPMPLAAEIAVSTVTLWADSMSIDEVIFCCFSDSDLQAYQTLLSNQK